VEFNAPLVKGDDLKDEEMTPLNVEVGTPDDEGRGTAGDGGVTMMGGQMCNPFLGFDLLCYITVSFSGLPSCN